MTTEQFYNQHLNLLAKNDAIELVEKDYNEDAEMTILTGDQPVHVKGIEAIKQLFTYYLANVYRGFVSTDKVALTDDSIFLEATIDTIQGHLKVYDAIYLKDGKIFRHYSGSK